MIKTTVTQQKVKNINYPLLKFLDDGTVVLFREPKCGTVIKEGEGTKYSYCLGMYSCNWDETKFEIFNSKLTLENGEDK